MPIGGLDTTSGSTKLRGQRFDTRTIGKMRGLKTYSIALSPQLGVGGIGYTQLPDGQYVLDTDLQSLRRQWAEGYDILTKQGFDAYNKAVTQAQEQSEAYKDIKAKYEALSGKQKEPIFQAISPYDPRYKTS